MKTALKLIAALIAALSTSCVTANLNVTRHHMLPQDLKGKTYKVAFTAEQKNSLEWQTYKQIAAKKIEKAGLIPASGKPDYNILLLYGMTGQRVMERQQAQLGVTSYGGVSFYQGRTPYGNYSGTVTHAPTYGITGTTSVPYAEFGHRVQVVVFDRSDKVVFDGNARSSSEESSNEQLVPLLINHLLSDFPGKSGKSSNLTVPLSVRW